jgi:hypothetical protein
VAWQDVVIGVVLCTVAFAVRRHVPADGLFYDDAWQAFGAWKGEFSELITVGLTQPGFTAGLMVWTRLFGTSTASLVTPAQIAGILGPAAIYAGLRWFGFSWSPALLTAAALASAPVHIKYSHHVKSYTFDVLIMLGLALAVSRLARRRWTSSTAIAWFVGSVVIGSFSSIALIAAVIASVVLVLHASHDQKTRLLATGAQFVALATLYVASSRTYNDDLIQGFFAARGGYIDFDPNPITFGREVFEHFWHVADVYPGGPATLSLALFVVGLCVAAWHGPLVVPARFLVLMIGVAAGGSVLGLIPFGPPRPLGRVTLWLVPAVALGLCAALELVRRRVAHRVTLRSGFDALVFVAVALVLVSSFRTDHQYPAGARSAIHQAMAEAGPDDAVITEKYTAYSFGLCSCTAVDLRATPDRQIGFLPVFSDPRLHAHDPATTPDELNEALEGRDRVFVVYAMLRSDGQKRGLFDLAVGLGLRGFARDQTQVVETGKIDVWSRHE